MVLLVIKVPTRSTSWLDLRTKPQKLVWSYFNELYLDSREKCYYHVKVFKFTQWLAPHIEHNKPLCLSSSNKNCNRNCTNIPQLNVIILYICQQVKYWPTFTHLEIAVPSLLVSQGYQTSPLGFLDLSLVPGIYTGKAHSGLAPLWNTQKHRLACVPKAKSQNSFWGQ